MDLQDILYNYIKDIELTEIEEKIICEYIENILTKTQSFYNLLEASNKNKELSDNLIEFVTKTVKGEK